MALTNVISKKRVPGNRREVVGTTTFDSSYPTGGEDFVAATVTGLSTIDYILFPPVGGRTFNLNTAQTKLLAYAGASEVANTTDLSAVTVTWIAVGLPSAARS